MVVEVVIVVWHRGFLPAAETLAPIRRHSGGPQEHGRRRSCSWSSRLLTWWQVLWLCVYFFPIPDRAHF